LILEIKVNTNISTVVNNHAVLEPFFVFKCFSMFYNFKRSILDFHQGCIFLFVHKFSKHSS